MPKNFGTPFIRLSVGGTLFGVDDWSINLSVIEFDDESSNALPTQAVLDTIRTAFVTRLGPQLGPNCRTNWAKAARIGANGLYPAGVAPVITSVAQGPAGTGTSPFPPQVALAVTLLGSDPRGPAGMGRFYLPAPATTIDGSGRATAAYALAVANGAAAWINDINTALVGEVGIVGPETAKGRPPARSVVTAVRVGRVFDTIRSRRGKFMEEPVVAATAVTT